MKITEGYIKNGRIYHDVICDDEEFKEVKNISKCYNCRKGIQCDAMFFECKDQDEEKCPYRYDCEAKKGVVRFLDCEKNAKFALELYSIITALMAGGAIVGVFTFLDVSIFKKIGFSIIAIVTLDFVCTLGEIIAPKVRDNLFIRKLRKIEKSKLKKEEEKKKAEEEKHKAEEKEKIAQVPNYQKIVEADNCVQTIRNLSDGYDFGANEESVSKCVSKLEEIIEILKKDANGYPRVAFLFEVYLPEFYNTISYYTYFIQAEAVTSENEQLFTQSVEKFYGFLTNQRVEAIFDKKNVESSFRSTAEVLIRMIDKGENQ